MFGRQYVDLSTLKGQVIENVTQTRDHLLFELASGASFEMYHEQDCCECVEIEDICGDLKDIIGGSIVYFEERVTTGVPGYCSATSTWYHIQCSTGHIVIRWLGESNGYYSESVSVVWCKSLEDIEKEGE